MSGILKSVCIKRKTDEKMVNIHQADLIKNGIPNDVHCDGSDKQISILPMEVINEHLKDSNIDYQYGNYGKNFVIEGLNYKNLKVGDSLSIGDVRLKITEIGAPNKDGQSNECKNNNIHKNFIFARVTAEGILTEDDPVYID